MALTLVTLNVSAANGQAYQQFALHTATPLVQAEDGNGDFLVSDFDRDGVPDLIDDAAKVAARLDAGNADEDATFAETRLQALEQAAGLPSLSSRR